MKYFFTLLTLIILCSFQASAQEWKVINNNDNHVLNARIVAYDSLNYIYNGYYEKFKSLDDWVKYSFIKATSDGGKTWDIIFRSDLDLSKGKDPLVIEEITMLSKNIIFFGSEKGKLFRTTNRGKTWDTTMFDTEGECRGIAFYKKYGMVTFKSYPFLGFTNDTGKTWQKMEKPKLEGQKMTYNIEDIKMFNDSSFILSRYNFANGEHWIMKTTDKGKNWISYKESDNYISRFFFLNDKIGYMGGMTEYNANGTPFIRKTTDGGLTWKQVWEKNAPNGSIYNIAVVDKNTVYALDLKEIIKTTDGGLTWRQMSFEKPEDFSNFYGLAFGSKTTGLIIMKVGYILSNSLSVEVEDNYHINNNILIYPNPVFNNKLNLNFSLQTNSTIKIDLINSLGIKVGKTLSDYFNAGSHTIRYSPDANLPSGTYWIRMTINNKETIVKPVVIIK